MSINLIITGDQLIKPYEITLDPADEVILGRSSKVDIRLPFPVVSSRHLAFRHNGMLWEVCDLGSTNGTVMAGNKLEPKDWRPLTDGVLLQILGINIQVQLEGRSDEGFTLAETGLMLQDMVKGVLQQKDATSDVAYLEGLKGAERGKRFPLHDQLKQVTIGAAPGSLIRMTHSDAPQTAATITIDKTRGTFVLEPDDEARVVVDGHAIVSPVTLQSGSVVEFDETVHVRFVDPLEDFLEGVEVSAQGGADDDAPQAPYAGAATREAVPLDDTAAPPVSPDATPTTTLSGSHPSPAQQPGSGQGARAAAQGEGKAGLSSTEIIIIAFIALVLVGVLVVGVVLLAM